MNPLRRILSLWLALVVGSSVAIAQGQTEPDNSDRYPIEVYAKGTGKPLGRAELRLGDQKAYTKPDGSAEIVVPKGQTITFQIYRSGFELTTIATTDLAKNQVTEIYLYPAQPDNNEVIVRGRRRPEVSKKNVTIEEAKAIAPRGDPAQITKLLPGVQSSPISAAIVVRGSEPDDSKYLVDNIEVPFVFHSIAGVSILPEHLLSDVEFSAGGFGPQHGKVTGGVVILRTKSEIPTEPKTQFKVNIPLLSGIYHERPISETEVVSASIRKSYVEFFIPQFVEDDMTVVPKFYDSHLRYVKTRDSGYTKVISLSSQDGLELLFPGGGNEDGELKFSINTYFGALGVEQFSRLDNGWSYQAVPQVRFTKVKNQFVDAYVDIRSMNYLLPVEFQKRLQGQDKFYIGAEFEYENAEFSAEVPRINQDDPFIDFEDAPIVKTKRIYGEGLTSMWLAYDLRLGDVVITPGARIFHASQVEGNGVDPRASMRWELSKEVRAKAAIGQYSKPPEPGETDPKFGNPDLDFEKSLHYIVGWERDWGDLYTLDLQVYYKDNFDVVRSDPDDRYENKGELRSRGVEVFFRRNRTERTFGWLSYTYSVTEDRDTTEKEFGPAQFDQTHNLNLVGNYYFTGQWSLGSRFNFHTGDRYTPVNDAVWNAGLGKYQPRYRDEDRYGKRLPDYYQVDIFSVYDFLFDSWKLKLRTGVEYLAAERPALGVDYNYDYSEEEFFRGLPPIPYIELSGEF